MAFIDESQLPEVVPTTHILTGMKKRYATLMGLNEDTPFVVGASDGVLSNLGVNAFKKGEVAVTIGTSGAIRTVIDKPRTDYKGRIFCYVLTENHYVIGGPVNNGGVILRRFFMPVKMCVVGTTSGNWLSSIPSNCNASASHCNDSKFNMPVAEAID